MGYFSLNSPRILIPIKEAEVFALDCEMVRTTKRNEVARLSLVNQDEKIILDILVKPRNKILDYHTKYSGEISIYRKKFMAVPAVWGLKFSMAQKIANSASWGKCQFGEVSVGGSAS